MACGNSGTSSTLVGACPLVLRVDAPGAVTLMGHVENYAEKFAAEKAARRVNDVKAVAEEIEVRLPFNVKHGDEEIAAAAVNRMKWSTTIPANSVQVKVEKGWVTLTGAVESDSRRIRIPKIVAPVGAM